MSRTGTKTDDAAAARTEATQKLAWLEQVGADATLTAACARLAILAGTRFLAKGAGGRGILSVAAAAKILDRSERTVSQAVQEMEEAGHWRISRPVGRPLQFEIIIRPASGFHLRSGNKPPKISAGVRAGEPPQKSEGVSDTDPRNLQGGSDRKGPLQEAAGVPPQFSSENPRSFLPANTVEHPVYDSVAPGARLTRAPGLPPSCEVELYDPPPAPEGLPECYDSDCASSFDGQDLFAGPPEAAGDDDWYPF